MARSHLRVYYGPQNEATAAVTKTKNTRDEVTVPLERSSRFWPTRYATNGPGSATSTTTT